MPRPLLFLLAFLILTLPVRAEEVSVTSTLDKRTAEVNEEIHLNIRIAGAQGNIQAPRLPAFKDFDTFYTGRASRITFVNNQSSSSVDFSYVLIPRSPGKHVLDPIEVPVGGQTFRTDAIPMEIRQASSSPASLRPFSSPARQSPAAFQSTPDPAPPPAAAYDEPPPTFEPDDDNVFVRAWADKTSAYPNEQIILTYSLYTRYDTRYEGFENEPEVSGFWIEEFPMEREIPRETVRIGGKRYVKADVKKVALFPTAAADYTIQPGTLKVSVRQEPQTTSVFDDFFNDSFFSGGSFFARRENRLLKPPPISIQVNPLPTQGEPAGFNGAVGDFRLSASVDKQEVKQDEPVTMKLVIEGEGNIETLNKPKMPELPQFKIYDSDTSSQLYQNGNVIGGRKTFEIVFIPIQSGPQSIPSVSFSFFHPGRRTYQTLATPEFKLEVSPSTQTFKMPAALGGSEVFKKEIREEGKDIRYLEEKIPNPVWKNTFQWLLRGGMAVDLILFVLLILGFLRERQAQVYARDSALKRRTFARSQAEAKIKRLGGLRRSRESGGLNAYFDEIEKILTQYLSDQFNLSAFGMTRVDLERQLAETFGTEDPLYREVLELYQLCDESRFAKAQVPGESKQKALKILRETMDRMERKRR